MDKLSTGFPKCPAPKPSKTSIDLIIKAKPYLKNYFDAKPDDSITVTTSKNDLPVLSINIKKPSDLHLTSATPSKVLSSKYDPLKEAQRMIPVDLELLTGSTIVLVIGLGNPLSLQLLLKKLKPNQICIVLESSFSLGVWLCNFWPGFTDFLIRPGCHLFCGEQMDVFLDHYMDSLPAQKLGGVRIVKNRISYSIDPDYYDKHEKRLQDILQSRMSDLLTRFAFEPLWIGNIISNTKYLSKKQISDSKSKQPENLYNYSGALKGIPAVLVSAGPSLRKSFAHLKELKKRAFILACDTALKPMLAAGVIPHAVFVLDAQKHSLFHFLGETDLHKIILFTDVVINPLVLRNINLGSVVFSTTAKSEKNAAGSIDRLTTPGTEFLEKIHGPLESLQSGGSVATSAFDLLRFLDCSKIILTGQDLSYTYRQIHSCGVHHYERWNAKTNRLLSLESINEGILKKRNTYLKSGIRSQNIVADYVLDIYKNWFSESVASIDLPVYNITYDGNHIPNIKTIQNPESFINKLDCISSINKNFLKTKALTSHSHDLTKLFLKEFSEILKSDPFIDYWNGFCKKYESLQSLNRRTETYIQRNSKNLEPQRIKNLVAKKTKETAMQLYQKLIKNYR